MSDQMGLEPTSQDKVPEWVAKVGIDLRDYKVVVEDDPVNQAALCTRSDMVAFYRAHFEVCLWLPLDPFICKFMEAVSAAPIDLNLYTVYLLVCFAIVCKHVGFEPRVSTFLEFFSIQNSWPKAGNLLSARAQPSSPQISLQTRSQAGTIIIFWSKPVMVRTSTYPKMTTTVRPLRESSLSYR